MRDRRSTGRSRSCGNCCLVGFRKLSMNISNIRKGKYFSSKGLIIPSHVSFTLCFISLHCRGDPAEGEPRSCIIKVLGVIEFELVQICSNRR